MDMQKEEALRQIQEINRVISSSNRFFMSGRLTIFYGVAILLIPVIEYSTQWLTFGNENLKNSLATFAAIHVVFYLALFTGLRRLVERVWEDSRPAAAHPILANALSVHRPFVVAICGTIFTFGVLDREELILPLIFVFFGILYNFYGRFTDKRALILSWIFIFLGFAHALMLPLKIPKLWVAFDLILGVLLIAMGTSLRKNREWS